MSVQSIVIFVALEDILRAEWRCIMSKIKSSGYQSELEKILAYSFL
jgi:hypothetical protein